MSQSAGLERAREELASGSFSQTPKGLAQRHLWAPIRRAPTNLRRPTRPTCPRPRARLGRPKGCDSLQIVLANPCCQSDSWPSCLSRCSLLILKIAHSSKACRGAVAWESWFLFAQNFGQKAPAALLQSGPQVDRAGLGASCSPALLVGSKSGCQTIGAWRLEREISALFVLCCATLAPTLRKPGRAAHTKGQVARKLIGGPASRRTAGWQLSGCA